MLETLLLAVLGSAESTVVTVTERTVSSAWYMPATVQTGQKEYEGESLYRGGHYRKSDEGTRKCIRDRESNNHYHAVNRSGTYRGAYQMSPELAVGAGWMIQRDLIAVGAPKGEARAVGESLRTTSVNKWHPFWQDYAFWIVWDKGRGKHHWGTFGQTHACY